MEVGWDGGAILSYVCWAHLNMMEGEEGGACEDFGTHTQVRNVET